MKLKKYIFTIILLAPLFSLINAGLNDEQPAASSEQPSHDCDSLPCLWQCKIPRCPDPFISLGDFPTPERIAEHLTATHATIPFDLDQQIFFFDKHICNFSECIHQLNFSCPSSYQKSSKKVIPHSLFNHSLEALTEGMYKNISNGDYYTPSRCVFCNKICKTFPGLKRHYKGKHPDTPCPPLPTYITYICFTHHKEYTHGDSARRHIKLFHENSKDTPETT